MPLQTFSQTFSISEKINIKTAWQSVVTQFFYCIVTLQEDLKRGKMTPGDIPWCHFYSKQSRTFLPRKKPDKMAKIKKGCVDDLATLSELNEEIILQELQARYKQDVIYVSKISPWRMNCFDADLFAFTQYILWATLSFVNLCTCLNIHRLMLAIFSLHLTRSSTWKFTTRM